MSGTRQTASTRAVALTVIAGIAALGGCGHTERSETGGSATAAGAAGDQAGPTAPVSGTLTGLYVDVAGGPLFTDCNTSRQWQVASDGAAKELDRAYLNVRSEPGDAVRATVEAHSSAHPPPGGTQPRLVVDKVLMLSGESVCPGQQADAPLTGTTWRALDIEGRTVDANVGALTLRLDAEAKTIQAYTGCRSLTGTFQWAGTELRFGGVSAGNDRCPANASSEAAALDGGMVDALRTAGSYRIRGDTLELMGANGVLARFAGEG